MLHYSAEYINKIPYCLYITGSCPMHTHGYWEIALFLRGLSYNHTPDNKIQCPPNYCIIFRPHKDAHFITHESGIIDAHLDIYISDEKLQEICNGFKTENATSLYNLLLNNASTPAFLLSTKATTYINELLSNYDFTKKYPEMENVHSLIITIILNEYFHSLTTNSTQPNIINEVTNLLRDPNNYCSRLEDLLKQIPYSRTYINREFKKYINKTPIEFFNHMKILFASQLLLQTDKTILDIACTIGFSSTKNFIEQFRKVFSCTPSAYRNSILSSTPPRKTK